MRKWIKKATVALAITATSASLMAAPAEAIVGGRINDTKSLALLFLGDAQCSGTVIAPEWVVTAKHCVQEGDSTIVIDKQNYSPTKAIVNPDADMALIKLDRAAHVTPARLAPSHLHPQEKAYAVGWGGGEMTGALMADATVQRRVNNLPAPLTGVTVIESQITKGRIERGDSGGPLFDESGDLAGVQSAAAGPGTVAFHVPVTEYLDWISKSAGIEVPKATDEPSEAVDASKHPTYVPNPQVPAIGSSVIESIMNYGLDLRFVPLPTPEVIAGS